VRGLSAFGPLLGLASILAIFASVYVLLGEEPPDGFSSLYGPIYFLFILSWMILDARRRRGVPCHDFGFLIGIFFPVSLAWYLIWTRGIKGLLMLAVFGFLFILPFLGALVIGVLKIVFFS
jgi:hypothetical protein